MKFSKSEVYEMGDALLHKYACAHREDGKEDLNLMMQQDWVCKQCGKDNPRTSDECWYCFASDE